jgi:hypothetical protein
VTAARVRQLYPGLDFSIVQMLPGDPLLMPDQTLIVTDGNAVIDAGVEPAAAMRAHAEAVSFDACVFCLCIFGVFVARC